MRDPRISQQWNGMGRDAILSAGRNQYHWRARVLNTVGYWWMGIADDFKLQGIFLKSFHYPEGESCLSFNALVYVHLYTFYYWLTLTPSLPMADVE